MRSDCFETTNLNLIKMNAAHRVYSIATCLLKL